MKLRKRNDIEWVFNHELHINGFISRYYRALWYQRYEKNGRKVTPKIQKRLDKYNMLQREVRAHDALYNTNPLDYVLNKDQYKKFNVHKDTKAAMRGQSKR